MTGIDEIAKSLPTLVPTKEGKTSRVRNGLVTGLAAWALYKQLKEWWTEHEDRDLYFVTVRDTDDVYPLLHEWILEQLPAEDRRSVRAYTNRGVYVDEEAASGSSVQQRVHLMYDGSRTQPIEIDGHDIEVSIDDKSEVGGEGGRKTLSARSNLQFRCPSVEGRDAVLKLLDELAMKMDEDEQIRSRVYIAGSWGSWSRLSNTIPRPIDTVVLPGDQKERLIEDMEMFFDAEEMYIKLGIPWHRGYLLHGPPGTGKTSTARGLASYFNVDVYYIPLSDLNTDTDLVGMMNSVTPHSMLLLEDIDIAHASRERDDVEKGVSLSGLLNALDGIVTPHGLITVMTTNNIDVLDPALVRPGRSDYVEYIGYADSGQIRRLLRAVLNVNVDVPDIQPGHKITPAQIVEYAKPLLTARDVDPDDITRAIEKMLAEKE